MISLNKWLLSLNWCVNEDKGNALSIGKCYYTWTTQILNTFLALNGGVMVIVFASSVVVKT